MTTAVFLDSQNPADLKRGHVRGLCGEICPTSSHDAYQAVSIKAEVPSDAEAEEDPLAKTSIRIKGEPEVSCVSVSMLGGFHKYKYPSFYKHWTYEILIHRTTYIRKEHILKD
jgi:hypothetical protein